uniref:Uncharacterized protein n=1 Tax=Romanomermis culicivorax TaxID=13658 RepID=A0A915HIA8_ROMCU
RLRSQESEYAPFLIYDFCLKCVSDYSNDSCSTFIDVFAPLFGIPCYSGSPKSINTFCAGFKSCVPLYKEYPETYSDLCIGDKKSKERCTLTVWGNKGGVESIADNPNSYDVRGDTRGVESMPQASMAKIRPQCSPRPTRTLKLMMQCLLKNLKKNA